MPSTGFQAVILCGPGASLGTFTTNPKDFPKALVPIANRPMVWYPLEWCYRMGVTSIHLITPHESAGAIEAALRRDQHLTSLVGPRPEVIAPLALSQTSGTAEIFRCPEVIKAIRGDFIVLPCDLICELNGTALLETWLVHQAALGGSLNDTSEFDTAQPALGGELAGRRGGLGLWYPAKGEEAVKNEETDFILTTDTRASTVVSGGFGMGMKLERLVYTTPMDSLKDSLELHKAFRLRNSLLRKFNKINLHTAYRDSHIYFLPYWVLEFMSENDRFDSIAEDVLGWWSKATWQEALRYKLSLQDILLGNQTRAEDGLSSSVTRQATQRTASQVDLRTLMSTTESHNSIRSEFDLPNQGITHNEQAQIPPVPPLLACLVPSQPQAPLIRRVDTPQLLLSVSLRLAKLLAVEDVGRASASPLAHIAKIAHPETIPKRCTVHASDSLLGNNVTVKEKVNIKESVIGAKCEIGEGVKLLRCVLMEEVQIGDYCHLTDCILGKRSKIEGGSARDEEKTVLKECEVQEGYLITWGTTQKGGKFMKFDLPSDDGSADDEAIDEVEGDTIAVNKVDSA